MKTKEKPKHNTLQNVGWMVNIAWKNGKRTLLFCLLTAALEVLLNLVQLYIAPEVLAKVGRGVPYGQGGGPWGLCRPHCCCLRGFMWI